MTYYRNFRCELTFDSHTGALRIESDMEASPLVDRLFSRESLLNSPFTSYDSIQSVEYRVHCNDPSNLFSSQNICSDIGVKQDPYLSESLSDSDICSELSSYTSCGSPAAENASASSLMVHSPVKTHLVDICDPVGTEKAGLYFVIRALLDELQQLSCKTLVKALLRAAIPAKKIRFPYKHGEKSRPGFWPAGVPHRQPDHMSKTHRIDLIHFLITEMPLKDVTEVLCLFRVNLARSKQPILDRLLGSLRVANGQQLLE